METAFAPRGSLSKGMAASIGVHLLIALYLVVTFSRAQPLGPPVDLSTAIPISLEMFHPTPPPPEPPKPQTPKEVVTTTAPEPEAQIEEAPVEPSPPAPPTPPEEPTSAAPSAPTYASLVAGIIERNKHYPREALESRTQGVVDAFFVLNHQGHVIAYRIEKGSGFPVLDREIVRLLKSVSFPPIPDDGGDPQRREFRLPIEFRMPK